MPTTVTSPGWRSAVAAKSRLSIEPGVAAWADQNLTVEEAARYMLSRAEMRCDRALQWSLLDVAAARVLARKAQELGFVEAE